MNEAIEASIEKWFKLVISSLHDGIVVADKNTIVQYVNPAWCRMTGVRAEDIIGRPILQVRPNALLPLVVKSGEAIVNVIKQEANDAEYAVSIEPIKENGTVLGAVTVAKDLTEVKSLIKQLTEMKTKVKELHDGVKGLHHAYFSFNDIVGHGGGLKNIVTIAQKIARADTTVLLTGESGTGKELFAHAIHSASERTNEAFVVVNCATFVAELLESELFGYDSGAFTGAKKGGRVGLFELANGGTIFLDEIAEMPLELQAKLLRALQYKRIRRVGGQEEIALDIRIIAATNQDLQKLVSQNKFREDLYYRLNVAQIMIPPLRERKEDIPSIVSAQLAAISQRRKKHFKISEYALGILTNYPWPGNVRELINALELATALSDSDTIQADHLPQALIAAVPASGLRSVKKSLGEQMLAYEKELIRKVLIKHDQTLKGRKAAALELQISVSTLYEKIKKYNI
ncbi:MAG: sigma 54-interacting transcriptional regulator [Sporomusaceae bacterium]|nr:sigma 54-interacting transcriptional regulator [Sporomusaceae bacterium]